MTERSGKKKLTRGEKWLLVAPLFVLLLFGLLQLKNFWFARTFPRIFGSDGGKFLLLRISRDGKQIVATNENTFTPSSTVSSWDIATGQKLWSFSSNAPPSGVDFSPDGQSFSVVFTSWQGVACDLEKRDLRTGKLIWTMHGADSFDAGIFSPDGKSVVTQGASVGVYDSMTGALKHTVPATCKTAGQWLRFTRDGATFMMLNAPPSRSMQPSPARVEFWSSGTGKKLRALPMSDTTWAELRANSDEVVSLGCLKGNRSQSFATGDTTSPRGLTQIWNYKTGQLLQTLPGADTASNLTGWRCLSKDGRLLFRLKKITQDNVISQQAEMIELRTGKIVWVRDLENEPFWCRFSPDGRFVGSSDFPKGAASGVVRLWDAKTGAQLKTFQTSSAWLPTDFTADSHYLAFINDNQIYLWDLFQYSKQPTSDKL
ncbi:MAG TPA: WD40 repeat domain-containing protein [Abditibacteriaceae bacterium]|jgi:outer membrane protein assembly factor BamB|nr:WD40 repeat domain-containing protein [Abditibacteriaceae bacterium]